VGQAGRTPAAGVEQVWIDGVRLESAPDAPGPACYTTARFQAGRVHLASRSAARLARDARALGLPSVDTDWLQQAMRDLARERFGSTGSGIVRFQASDAGRGRLRLVGSSREIGPEPATWSAIIAADVHPGPSEAPGAKLANRPAIEAARREVRRAGVSEALLFDAADRLVEGSRANLLVATGSGEWCCPPLARGAVRGVALEVAMAGVAELREADIPREQLRGARELVAINSVRGACPIVRVDGRAVGSARPGPLWQRLRTLLDAAD
jgi:branched-subunit amino acid aminotransferase/4-amino-4-deoxychorismate lyase